MSKKCQSAVCDIVIKCTCKYEVAWWVIKTIEAPKLCLSLRELDITYLCVYQAVLNHHDFQSTLKALMAVERRDVNLEYQARHTFPAASASLFSAKLLLILLVNHLVGFLGGGREGGEEGERGEGGREEGERGERGREGWR